MTTEDANKKLKILALRVASRGDSDVLRGNDTMQAQQFAPQNPATLLASARGAPSQHRTARSSSSSAIALRTIADCPTQCAEGAYTALLAGRRGIIRPRRPQTASGRCLPCGTQDFDIQVENHVENYYGSHHMPFCMNSRFRFFYFLWFINV